MPLPPDRLLVGDHPEAVAELVAEKMIEALTAATRRPLGLATGRTMEPVYAALRRRLGDLDPADRVRVLEGWSSFNLDDYIGLARDHPASFHAAMGRNLGQPLGLSAVQLRLPDGGAPDPAAEAQRYAAELAAAGGLGLQLLGLGENGHVGFNEPPCGPGVTTRCVRLSAVTRRQNAAAFGGDPDQVPQQAITVGLAEILAARSLLLVVTGASKAPILRQLLEGPPQVELPASWLLEHPDLVVVADRAALGH